MAKVPLSEWKIHDAAQYRKELLEQIERERTSRLRDKVFQSEASGGWHNDNSEHEARVHQSRAAYREGIREQVAEVQRGRLQAAWDQKVPPRVARIWLTPPPAPREQVCGSIVSGGVEGLTTQGRRGFGRDFSEEEGAERVFEEPDRGAEEGLARTCG